jgi:hypothetical protein
MGKSRSKRGKKRSFGVPNLATAESTPKSENNNSDGSSSDDLDAAGVKITHYPNQNLLNRSLYASYRSLSAAPSPAGRGAAPTPLSAQRMTVDQENFSAKRRRVGEADDEK